MDTIKYPRGSEWRKWDLHFHTPSSQVCYQNKSVTNNDIIENLIKDEISVVAITDHHIIDIERIKELQDLSKEQDITILPGIEFLSETRGKEPIHFIGIFPEHANLEHIWGQISNKTEISGILGEGKKVNEVYCNLSETVTLVKNLGGVVSIHAGSKTNSIENITNSLPHTVAQKTDIASLVDIFELGQEKDQNDYRKIVFPAIGKEIPMVLCSDNHNVIKYNKKQNLWIKADPCFAGLKHALSEPSSRIFIGSIPDALEKVKRNKTKYINNLSVKVIPGKEDEGEVWFESVDIPVNTGLVAIIGNKGSGKSAITDIIGLCTDAEHSSDYLFLHKDKFKKKGYADRFEACVTWQSGSKTETISLDSDIDPSEIRKVQYLPQRYFESICNEIGKVESFRKEIEKVVFQYIPLGERLGKSTFDEFVSFKKSSIDGEIATSVGNLYSLNKDIISLEDKKNPEYKSKLISSIEQKEEELRVHDEAKPEKIENPDSGEETEEAREKKVELARLEAAQNDCLLRINWIEEAVLATNVQVESLKKLKRDILSKVGEFQNFIKDNKEEASDLGIDLGEIVKVTLDMSQIDNWIENNRKNISELNDLLGDVDENNGAGIDTLKSRQSRLLKQIKDCKSTLSDPQKKYQKYLEELKIWEEGKKNIIGDKNTSDTLINLKDQLKYLEEKLSDELFKKRQERLDLSMNIYRKKNEVKVIYDEIKNEIDKKLIGCEVSNFNIVSSFALTGDFIDSSLSYIKQNRIGSFYGAEEGKKLLKNKIINDIDWDKESDVKKFLESMIEYLDWDKRSSDPDKHNPTFIGDIVNKRSDFYSFIFSLDYLEPHYGLQQNCKDLEQLSPGERGALLLVFYLILDKEEIPLIIDQPEDNLDNHSVAKVLVPFIRDAKKQRQIIMVTHNPNLAVVADAEQIIRVGLDKENNNKFLFKSGSIEETKLNKEVVDVLEGTMPAFTARRTKYHEG